MPFVKLTDSVGDALCPASSLHDAPVLTQGMHLPILSSVYLNLESKVRLSLISLQRRCFHEKDHDDCRAAISSVDMVKLVPARIFAASGMDGFCGGLVCNVVDF